MFYVESQNEKNLLKALNLDFKNLEKVLKEIESLGLPKTTAEDLFNQGMDKMFDYLSNLKEKLANTEFNLSDKEKIFFIAFVLNNMNSFKNLARLISKENFQEENFNFYNQYDFYRFLDSLYFSDELKQEMFFLAILGYLISMKDINDWKLDFIDEPED
jgi:antitoxin component YwqK of YwqJK toxin-antitoxin module